MTRLVVWCKQLLHMLDRRLAISGWAASSTNQLSGCLIQGRLDAAAVGTHPEAVADAGALPKAHGAVDRAVRLPRRWLLQAGGEQQAGRIQC